MNHYVPDFEMDEDYAIQNTSGSSRSKKSPMADEEIMELLWRNGQVVMHSQNQRSFRRSHNGDAVIPPDQSAATTEIRPEEESATQLFIHEQEMASWLHYPMDDSSLDRDFYSDLIYPAPRDPVAPPARTAPIPDEVRIPTPSVAASAASRPPIPPSRRPDVESPARIQNFLHFSRAKGRTEPGPSISNRAVRASTVVDSSQTAAPECRDLHAAAHVSGGNVGYGATASGAAVAGTSSAGGGERETGPCELTVTSSPGGSGASASAEPVYKQPPPPITEDRKRKGMEEADRAECQSEQDADFESPDAKKQVRGSTSTKRSRAAEVHNLSERRRRDRINEKMKALQELIPRCNKSDKASMLDEAIEYLKSLQLQVQMMSMGCTMVPMMFPGVQQYMPPMGMGMGMGMEMGMNGPMMQFPSVLSGSAMPVPSANARLGPTFQMPAFHMQPPVPLPDQSRIQETNQSDLIHNSMGTQNPNPPRMPSFADPYQQYRSLHHMQLPLPQNQAMMQPSTSPNSQQGSRDT